jgi:hypothetical protein
MRVQEDGDSVVLLSEHERSEVGMQWRLSDYPATRHLIATGQPGQVVAGDPLGDPAELEELERMGLGAMLIVPTPLGALEPALVEIYRGRPQAFSRAEVERARVVVMQIGAALARLRAR